MEDLSKNTLDPKSRIVMIVDDDDSIRELLEFVVKKEGFQVEKAADGEEALRKIGSTKPHLILLDLMLPRYGGFEVLRHLQSGDTAKIPIVVLTGRYTDRSTAEMIRQESNVVEFLEKPVKPPVLTHMIHKILKTKPADGKKPAA
jgi:DNA-binding response OmpR family regulator